MSAILEKTINDAFSLPDGERENLENLFRELKKEVDKLYSQSKTGNIEVIASNIELMKAFYKAMILKTLLEEGWIEFRSFSEQYSYEGYDASQDNVLRGAWNEIRTRLTKAIAAN